MFFGLRSRIDWLVEFNILEKHAVFIFRAKMICWESEGTYTYRVAEG
jgi:hypothetical protein